VGVLVALTAYFWIFKVTGDSDLFIAIASGAAGAALTWGWISALHFARIRAHKASQSQEINR
jgi:hypothetical protein